jgi:hypothetical protein
MAAARGRLSFTYMFTCSAAVNSTGLPAKRENELASARGFQDLLGRRALGQLVE